MNCEINQNQIVFASNLIASIDSGESGLFLEKVNTENQIEAKIFYNVKMAGIFFSLKNDDKLRISIAFKDNTDNFNDEITLLIQSSVKNSNMASCAIWVKNENRKIIEYIKKEFNTTPDGANYYASIEFIMRREKFNKTTDNRVLKIKPYEESNIDDYLSMLDNSMTFANPPPNFMGNKEHFLRYFAEQRQKNSFESFWKEDELIGLYWRKDAEIDIMAVAVNHQRKGYVSIILTRAIEMVFENTTEDYAYLYAVDWNVKGQSFYKKYGMEQNGHSYLLHLNNTR